MRWGLLFSLFLVVIAFFVTSSILYELAPGERENFLDPQGNKIPIINQEIVDDFPEGVSFYPNIRFASKKISYYIDDSCEGSKANDSRKAFEILENETSLTFEEKERGDIKVSCSEEEQVPKEGFFIAGEGGPNSIINASNFYVIKNGTILLYRENKCAKPIVGLHEILHVLGFKHSSNKKSIMSELSDCSQQLTSEIINTIERVYKYETLPDLIVKRAYAIKSGRYLRIEVEIFNAGLDLALESQLGIYADGELVSEYNMGEIEVGSGKIIKAENLRVPRDVKELKFKIDSKEIIFEIFEDNNEKILVISE